jgi:aspartyl-tRNA(Asn)/glutamyl-tRNA(Gln) amidotransferase subunit C
MADRASPVDEVVVRHVASLARLEVAEGDLPRLTEQLARIVSYIDQLKEITEESVGPGSPALGTPLRTDEPAIPCGGARALAENSPRSLHGYGAVPRVVGEAE